MKKMRRITAAIVAATLVLSIGVVNVSASENKMRSIATPIKNKDWSVDPEKAPMLAIKAEIDIEAGSYFTLELSDSAEWTFDNCSSSALSPLFDKSGDTYTSKDAPVLTNQEGFNYNVEVLGSDIIQIWLNETLNTDNMMAVPMIVKIDGLAEATVDLYDGETFGISSGSYIFANKGKVNQTKVGITSNAKIVEGTVGGDIVITSTASLGETELALTLPENFKFDEDTKNKIEISGEGSYSAAALGRISYNNSKTTMYIAIEKLRNSTSEGKITISNIFILPEDINKESEVIMAYSGFGVEKGKFKFMDYRVIEPLEMEEPGEIIEITETEQPAQPESYVVTVSSGSKAIFINGEQSQLEAAAYNDESGRMMVPLRFISEAFGITDDNIDWDANNKVVTMRYYNNGNLGEANVIVFKIGESEYYVNQQVNQMDTVAVIKDERTFVPVYYVADSLNIGVKYIPETKTAEFTR